LETVATCAKIGPSAVPHVFCLLGPIEKVHDVFVVFDVVVVVGLRERVRLGLRSSSSQSTDSGRSGRLSRLLKEEIGPLE